MRLLIAIPVHNELKYVDHVLDKVLHYHGEVLAIDDGSTDGTSDLLRGRRDIQLIHHAVNRGYDWVITMDCDEQHEPEMIPAFVREICTDRWDIISGSRYMQPSKDDDLPPGDRRMVNATITTTINELFGWKLTDAFCGFKAHRVCAMRGLTLDEPGYAFPMQLWPQVWRAGLRLTELPVRLIYNDPNRSFGGVLDETQIRLRHYLDVLARETNRPAPVAAAEEPVPCGCGCPE